MSSLGGSPSWSTACVTAHQVRGSFASTSNGSRCTALSPPSVPKLSTGGAAVAQALAIGLPGLKIAAPEIGQWDEIRFVELGSRSGLGGILSSHLPPAEGHVGLVLLLVQQRPPEASGTFHRWL